MTPISYLLSIAALTCAVCMMVVNFHWNRFLYPTVLGTYFLWHLLMQLVPSVFFVHMYKTDAAVMYHWACVVNAVLIPIGGLAANCLLRAKPREMLAYYKCQTDTTPNSLSRVRDFYVIFASACAVIFLLYVTSVPTIPVLQLFKQTASTSEVNELRRQVRGVDMDSSLWYLYGVTQVLLMPFLFTLSLAMWKYTYSHLRRVTLVGSMVMAIVYGAYTSAKTPVAMLFVMACILAITRREGHATRMRGLSSRKAVIIIVSVSCAIGYPIIVFFAKAAGGGAFQDGGFFQILTQGVLSRIFYKPAYSTYLAFEVFPTIEPFTNFMDVGKLARVLGHPQFPLSKIMAFHKGHEWGSNSPPATVGTFYAQYGWTAVVFGSFLAGLIAQTVNIYLVRTFPKTIVHEVVYALLLYGAFRISMAKFHSVFLTEAFVPSVLLLMLWGSFTHRHRFSSAWARASSVIPPPH